MRLRSLLYQRIRQVYAWRHLTKPKEKKVFFLSFVVPASSEMMIKKGEMNPESIEPPLFFVLFHLGYFIKSV